MKKSQILAALALAFALGVVAPVAGTYAEEGIMPLVDTGTTTNAATTDNLKSAVNYVTSDATYQAFAALAEAKAAATAAGVKDVAAANTALTTALADFDNATITGGTTVAALTANTSNLKSAVGANYDKYVELVSAMDADAAKIGSQAAIDGVAVAMQALGYTFNPVKNDKGEYTEAFDDVKTAAEGVIDGDDKTKDYSVYEAAVKAVSDAEVTAKAFGNYQKALQNSKLGLTKAQAKTVNEANTIAALNGVTPADAANWNAVITKIDAINTAIKNASTQTDAARYDLLANATTGLLKLMQTATDNDDLTYEQLISAAPTDPEQPDNKPEDNDNNGDKDDSKDPSAPGTGIVGSSEGNAATTVSMVAGLATALTALGAGVVAYRSARRSSEK